MAKRKSSIGASPLDAVVPTKAASEASKRGLAPAGTHKRPEKAKPIPKERLTVHISSELVERLRDAVYWTPGLTLAAIAEEALSKAIAALERKNGEPFQKRKGQLKAGRPVK